LAPSAFASRRPGMIDVCAGAVPARIVVVCGIIDNITVSDIQPQQHLRHGDAHQFGVGQRSSG
jgi:hypothetical protein